MDAEIAISRAQSMVERDGEGVSPRECAVMTEPAGVMCLQKPWGGHRFCCMSQDRTV